MSISITPGTGSKRARPASDEHAGQALVRGDGRAAEVVEIERALVSFFVGAAELLGVPKSVAAIYGICFASPAPLGFSEIHERLDISSGSISQGLKVLREIGALKVVQSPLERRDRFEPDLELRKLISHYIERRLEAQIDSGRDALQAIVKQAPVTGDPDRVLKARLNALQMWHKKAAAALPVLKTFLKLA